MSKGPTLLLNALPILVMIGLVPVVANDYLLTALYLAVIAVAFATHRERNDAAAFVFGFFAMIVFETLFVSTGVETFARNTLLGLMPLWLPFLWGYAFVAITRTVKILGI